MDEKRFLQLEKQVTQHGHALQTIQPGFPSGPRSIHRRLALPIPLGSLSIGSTTWLLGLLTLHARGTTTPQGVILCGLPFGAFFTLLCGVGELFSGNTFGCALYLNVGAIIFGLCLPFLPWTSVTSAFGALEKGNAAATVEDIDVATGMYLLVIWGSLFVLLIAAQRTAISVVAGLVTINLVVITLGIGLMTGNEACLTAAGAFLIIVSFILFYNAAALLLLEVGHPLARFMPLGSLAPKQQLTQ